MIQALWLVMFVFAEEKRYKDYKHMYLSQYHV